MKTLTERLQLARRIEKDIIDLEVKQAKMPAEDYFIYNDILEYLKDPDLGFADIVNYGRFDEQLLIKVVKWKLDLLSDYEIEFALGL